MKPYEMCAVLAVFTSEAMVDTKQVGIGAIDTFAQGNTDLRNGDLAGFADSEKVFAFFVFLAALQAIVPLEISKNPASHKNMVSRVRIRLDFPERFVNPMDTVFAVNHGA